MTNKYVIKLYEKNGMQLETIPVGNWKPTEEVVNKVLGDRVKNGAYTAKVHCINL